jgi:hypothetical protein
MSIIPFIKVSNYLSSMDGVSIYPIITLIIFFGFFALMFVLTYKIDKKKLEENSQLPLKENQYEKH